VQIQRYYIFFLSWITLTYKHIFCKLGEKKNLSSMACMDIISLVNLLLLVAPILMLPIFLMKFNHFYDAEFKKYKPIK